MKLIVAVIQPQRLQVVLAALERCGAAGATVCDAQGYARQRGQAAMYRGHEYKSHLLRKVSLEIAVSDDQLERTVSAIQDAARTGEEGAIGDGKILIIPIGESVQISDGTRRTTR